MASRELLRAGCQRIYLDGSYVTEKAYPGDYDVCWDPEGVDERILGILGSYTRDARLAQKRAYHGEFFPSTLVERSSGVTFVEYFQRDKIGGGRKGILHVELAQDPIVTLEPGT